MIYAVMSYGFYLEVDTIINGKATEHHSCNIEKVKEHGRRYWEKTKGFG